MNSSKTLVIIFWDLGIGGIQTRFVDLINYLLDKTKINIVLLLKRRLAGEIKIPKNKRLDVRYYSSKVRKHGEYQSEPVGFGRWLLIQLIKIRPDYLLTFLCRYSLIGNIYKIMSFVLLKPVFHTINEGIFTSKYLVQHEEWYWKYIVGLSYPMADQVIVPTQAIKSDLKDNFNVPADKIQVVPSWVDKKRQKNVKKKYDGIFVGRLAPEKGLEELLNLFKFSQKKKNKYKFAVIGDGEKRAWFENQLKKHKLNNVNYLGYQDKSHTLENIRESKLLLLPSKNEGLPMVVLEAASLGVPSLVIDLPGISEIIDDGENGFLCTKNTLIRYFQQIIKDDLWTKAKDKALRRVRKDHGQRNLDRFSSLVINGK